MKLNRQNGAWKKVEKYLKECIAFGFLIAAAAHGLTVIKPEWLQYGTSLLFEATGHSNSDNIGVTRAIIFFAIGYLTVVPVYFFRSMFVIWGIKVVKKITIFKKIAFSLMLVIVVPVILAFQFLFFASGGPHYLRMKAVYEVITNSYIGLAILGVATLWVDVLCLMALFGFVPLIGSAAPQKALILVLLVGFASFNELEGKNMPAEVDNLNFM